MVEFVRALNRVDATALVAGSMIGSGVFIVSADIARQVGSPGMLLLVWLIAGVTTVIGALTYSELASLFPKAGGQYVYLREGVSPLFGYLYGWTLFTVIQTGTIAAVAVAFARFTSVFIPALTPDVFMGWTAHLPSGDIQIGLSPQRLLAIISVIALTWINVRGVRTAAAIQTALTGIKIASLGALVVLGLTLGRNHLALSSNFGPGLWGHTTFMHLLPSIGAAMIGALFAMDAWNNVGFAAGELKDPKRDLAFAMVTGVCIVVVLYLLANLAYLSSLTLPGIANAPQDRVATAALQAMFGDAGLTVMAAAIMISTFGCNNGLILAGARVFYAMARDGLFLKRAALLHRRYQTPSFALWIQAAWTCALCLSGTYSQLLDYVMFAAVLFYLLTAIGLFVLRVRRKDAARPVKVPLYPFLPALYVLLTAGICANLLIQRPQYTWPGLCIVVLGVPVYLLWRKYGARPVAALLTAAVFLCGVSTQAAHAQAPPAERHDITIENSKLALLIPPQLSQSATLLTRWTQRSATIVAHYFGRFPVPEARIAVIAVNGSRVAGGTTFGTPAPLIRVRVGSEVDDAALLNDWVLVHEMTHLALPDVGEEHAWLSEGLAVYIEGVARVQAGNRSIEDVFTEEMHSMPRGMPGTRDAGLDHDQSWGRTYWGGAMFCLMADVAIHQRTGNRHGLQDAMRAVLSASGGLISDWDINKVFATADAAVGVPVLSELYAQMKDKPVAPDLVALWHSLGVDADGNSVRLNDTAPLASIRRAIFKST
ncbi:MAG TPA: amino acid permease [Steroidobacteraceae bacterium]|jgi:APA family basic amino acid/polyamine antiporter